MDKQTDETQLYVARGWYRDPATLFNIASFLFLVLSDGEFMKGLPDTVQHAATKFIVLFNLWIRFQSSTRPVALSQGTPREVYTIPMKGTGDGRSSGTGSGTSINPGSVSDDTRSKL